MTSKHEEMLFSNVSNNINELVRLKTYTYRNFKSVNLINTLFLLHYYGRSHFV